MKKLTLVVLAATIAAAPTAASPYVATRLNDGRPIIDQAMFDALGVPDEGENINGPSLIRVPEWIAAGDRADPAAEYYLYFAHHAGDYIRMAWAASLGGPWTLYGSGVGVRWGAAACSTSGRSTILPSATT